MSLLNKLAYIALATITSMAMVFGVASSASATTASQLASVQVGDIPFGIAISPDGTKAYVANTSVVGTVSVIDIASRSVTATITVGSRAYGIAFTPDGSKAYVANRDSDNVSVINVATDSVSATIPVGSQPYGVTVSLDGSSVYVANNGSNTVSVIQTSTDTVTASINVPAGPIWLATNPVSGLIYVTSMNAQELTAISGTTVSGSPLNVTGAYSLAVTPDGALIYVADNSGTIFVVSASTFTTSSSIVTNTAFYGMATVPNGNYLFFPDSSPNTLNRISVSTGQVATGDGYPLTLSQASASNVAVTPDCTTALVVTPNYPFGSGQGYVSIVSTGFANCASAPSPTPSPTPALATTGAPMSTDTQGLFAGIVVFSALGGIALVTLRRRFSH